MKPRNYFLAIFVPYVIAMALFVLVAVDPGASEAAILIPFLTLASSVAPFVLVYRMWSAVRTRDSRMTGHLAVLGYFIPIFNIYWAWRVWSTWPDALARAAAERDLEVTPVAKRPFAMMVTCSYAGPVLMSLAVPLTQQNSTQVLAMLFGLGGLALSITALVLFVLVVRRTCRGVNELRLQAA